MGFGLAWLGVSHGVVVSIGAALFASGAPVWGAIIGVGIPLVRLVRRLRPGGAYWLLGYAGAVGGDRPTRGGRITRADAPVHFAGMLLGEIAILVLLFLGAAGRGGTGRG